ncbi:staygreen family protein [Anaeromicrobium sediminis]|uniref:Staygreen protein domain-containing protein n=1 Tax=Anaeromicrobium sediminis TaxID=1478221 RepID=A0A267MKZ3_9FIRM|nr:staygreen family protein [Anaeromicrobium sediminis]PAB60259.1 hypothetical protein CCE28_04995 [Anaeromicrobium sediminis]
MSRLDPNKLQVDYFQGVTPVAPILGRHYTLTHSDETAELFLAIGRRYAYERIGPMRDEVLGHWFCCGTECILKFSVYLGGENRELVKKRYEIFVRELPLALEAIMYGDRCLFESRPFLYETPIFIHFQSPYEDFDHVEQWGVAGDWKIY